MSPSEAAVQPLDARTFPLHGMRLIEASAGTGKTYTIAMLYVRLVLNHGGEDQCFGRPLSPPEILVVTFTDAAAKELRDRIRRRLGEAAACFLADEALSDGDLRALRDDIDPQAWPACAQRLQQAMQWMDEAAVQTIHSWCHRMLHAHVLDGAAGFDQQLVGDDARLLSEAARDYWRCHGYGLSAEDAAWMQAALGGPDALAARLKPLLSRAPAALRVAGAAPVVPDSVTAALAASRAARDAAQAAMAAARSAWLTERPAIERWLREVRGSLHGGRHRWRKEDDRFEAVLAAMAAWSEGGPAPAEWGQFAPGRLHLNGGVERPDWLVWQAIGEADAASAAVPDPAPSLLLHAAQDVRARVAREKRRLAQWGYDDLLQGLDEALHAEVGDALAARIRGEFPVAMIDEFQDTDPLQYRLFDRIYGDTAPPLDEDAAPGRTGLFLIGDPKQAIYGFRGADIYTYLRARQATQGRHYTLVRNFRATESLVSATNQCFQFAESHPAGAFRFRTPDGNPVPFVPVQAQGRTQQLWLDGAPAPAITCWTWADASGGPVSQADYRREMAERSATAVRTWLSAGDAERYGLREADGRARPLQPSDVAVLVRNRLEAADMRAALARRGLASVYLSDQESVFQTPEADDVMRWLQACAAPGDDRLVRVALATASLGLDWATLDHLHHDDVQWERVVLQFRDYQARWRRQGVLPMLRRLMADFELPAHLLAEPGGERRLTNLLQLAEWLQREAMHLEGETALLRRYAARRDEPGGEDILRLESDADRIRVVTIHKSKGLEYPLVLLPFIAGWRSITRRPETMPAYYDAQAGQSVIDLVGTDDAYARMDEQRLDEDMRLLYVAMTRARHAVWLGVAPLSGGGRRECQLHRGALGYLLSGGEPVATDAVDDALHRMAGGHPAIQIAPAPDADDRRYEPPPSPAPGPARPVRWSGARPWWIASYSALAAGAQRSEAPPAASAGEDRLREDVVFEAAEPAPPAQPAAWSAGLLDFPRGAAAGDFLHGLLEWAAQHGFADAAADPAMLRDQVARRCQLRRWTAWIDPLCDWLQGWLRQSWPLMDGRWVAAELAHYRVEMEFWFPVHAANLQAVDALIQRHVLPGRARPRLADERLSGLFKGYVDLVFEQAGRYYVVDYKSNWLGTSSADYDREALSDAMLAHRYDLQYVLYLFAVHRLLQSRLPDYDYDRHMGGACYHFLRGEAAPGQGVYLDRPPRALMDALDGLFSTPAQEAP